MYQMAILLSSRCILEVFIYIEQTHPIVCKKKFKVSNSFKITSGGINFGFVN